MLLRAAAGGCSPRRRRYPRDARFRALCFLPGDPRAQRPHVFAATATPTAKRIRNVVEERPGLRVAEACTLVGMGREQVHYHVRKLVAAGVLRVERRAMGLRLFPA